MHVVLQVSTKKKGHELTRKSLQKKRYVYDVPTIQWTYSDEYQLLAPLNHIQVRIQILVCSKLHHKGAVHDILYYNG